MYSNYLNNAALSRGLRNNNPGNLIITSDKWQGRVEAGTDAKFVQFLELRWGIRAFYKNAISQINKGVNTVQSFISKYAPASDNNDTAAYVASVARSLGISATAKFTVDKAVLKALAKACFAVEVGKDYPKITEKDYQDAFDVLGVDLKEGTSHCAVCGAILGAVVVFFFTYFTVVIA